MMKSITVDEDSTKFTRPPAACGHTGTSVPASSVAPTVEHITERYQVLKGAVYDFLLDIHPQASVWRNPATLRLAKLIDFSR